MKKKISKALAVLLSAVILFAQAIPTFAALVAGNKYSYTTTYLDAYYTTGDWETADGVTHNNYGQVALRNLTSTDEPLYCIQVYEGCDNSAATAASIKTTNLWKNELTTVARSGITRVSIYGYPNYRYGYSATNAQLATQVLIWEFEIGRRQSYAVKTTSFADQIFSNYPNAEACYLKIVEACASHENKPSFSNTTVTLKGTGSGNAVSVTDTNGVLSSFSVSSSSSRINASISGNKLTVYATGTGAVTGKLTFTKENTNIDSAFALTGANQTLFYGTLSDPVTSSLTVELSLGTLVIHKDSEDGNKAVSFKVTGNGVNKTVTTSSEGTVTITDLEEGDYDVEEINQDKYHPHTDSKTAHVTAGATENVYFYNVLVKGKIYVQKQGETLGTVSINEDGTYTPVYTDAYLAGAEYDVYAAEDITNGTISIAKGTLVDHIVTDSNGSAATGNLYLKEDGSAAYKVVETKAPEGYVLDTEEHTVTLTMTEAGVDTGETLELYNDRQKASVSLSKIMERDDTFNIGSNNEILSVQFGVYAGEDVTASDETVIPANALVAYANCDENGNITFDCDLPIGYMWYIKEIETDNHYVLSDEQYYFDTEYAGQDIETINLAVNNGEAIENKILYGTVKGLKLDRETNEAVEGAVFGLFNGDETNFTEENAILTAQSDEDGIFTFENIPYGDWVICEIEAANGYLANSDVYNITIDENEQVIELTVVNDKIPELKTTASIDGKKEVTAQGEVTITDTVEYKHLIVGEEYVIKGILMDRSTGKAFMVNGKTVTSEVTFTPEKSNGTVEVTFTFDTSGITKDTELVVFETLYRDGVELAAHSDLEDKGQTVTIKEKVVSTVISPKTGADNDVLKVSLAIAGTGAILSTAFYSRKKAKINKKKFS